MRGIQKGITKIINPDKSTRIMTYDDKNNLTSEKDENGKYTFYRYDSEKKNLVKKVQPLNGTDMYADIDSDKFAITYITYYTEEERVSKGYKEKGLIKEITGPGNNTTKYEYEYKADGSVVKTVTDPTDKNTIYTYDRLSRLVKKTTPKGYVTNYIYDNNGRLEKTEQVGEEKNSITRITYDSMGRKTKEVSPNLYDAGLDNISAHTYSGEHGTRYTYYDSGMLKTLTDAEDHTTSYTYDIFGNIETETKPNGAVYEYKYDVMNRPIKVLFKDNASSTPVVLYEYSYSILADGKTQKTEKRYLNDEEIAITTITYDYAGREISWLNPDGTTKSVKYNANGTVDSSTNEDGYTTYYKYDGLNRLTEQWTPFEVVNGKVKYSYTRTEYDKAGNEHIIVKGKDTVELNKTPTQVVSVRNEYDGNGRLILTIDSEGRKKEYRYDDDGNLSKELVFTDNIKYIKTEYDNNYLGKPKTKKVYVFDGDIYGNPIERRNLIPITTTYTYDYNGNLKEVTTPDNVTTTYSYDKLDRQTSVSQPGIDEYGNSAVISTVTNYDWEGNVIVSFDAKGNKTEYTYNKRGQLEKITDANGKVTAYYYDRAGRKIAEVAPKDYDSSKDLSQMNRLEYTYDLMDRLKTKSYVGEEFKVNPITFELEAQQVNIIQNAYKYNKLGFVIKELDALGYEAGTGTNVDSKINTGYGTETTYNLAGYVETVKDPVTKERSLSYTMKYTYDALGRKTSETNAKGVITNYYYDDAGNITFIKYKKSASADEITLSSYTYDFVGNLLSETDANENITTYEYNNFNMLRKAEYPGDKKNIIVYQYDVMGNLKLISDSMGAKDVFTYDNQGRELSHTRSKLDDTDSITEYSYYDLNGNKRFEKDGELHTWEYTYDKLNRLKTSKITVNGIVQTTTYGYDDNGNQTSVTDWRGNTSTDIYDSLNRLIGKKDQFDKYIEKLEYNHNNVQTISYDALNHGTYFTYDKNNRLLTTKDPEGHTIKQTYDNVGNIETKKDGKDNLTTFVYDELGRLKSVKNAKNETTVYDYDNNGNMISQTDGKNNVTYFEYNAANKLSKRIDPGGRIKNADGTYTYDFSKIISYTYNADGSIDTITDRNGKVTKYEYDVHGRVTSKAIGTNKISYTYFKDGNLKTITDSTGTTERTYDALDRVTSKKVPGFGECIYNYDIILDANDGSVAEKSTDPKGNVTTKVYDKAGRLWKVIADGKTTTYSYYDNGSVSTVEYSDYSKEVYTYYKDNLLKELRNKRADGTDMDVYTYYYDAAHNISSKKEVINGSNKGETSYKYDVLNRLEKVTEPNGTTTTYTYDAAGNRKTETIVESGTTTYNDYEYNSQNRLVKITTKVNNVLTQVIDYAYDNNGNQLTTTKTPYSNGVAGVPEVLENIYDEFNQLIKTTSAGVTVENTYNGDGLRVSKKVGSTVIRYLYEYDKVVLEIESQTGQQDKISRNVYGTNLLMRTVDGQSYYYMYNGHADVTALINVATGNVDATYYYDAFGNIVESIGAAKDKNSILYSGYQYDKETGLYYLNARMYDPTIARFLQEDTYYGDPNDPLSLNLYTYCHNEPLMYYDPTGHYYQKQYVAGQGLVDVWVNETGFFGAIKNVNHAVEEALENVRDKMTDITSSVNGRIKSFAAEQVDRTKEGFVALTNSEKRKEAFELIDEYGSESDKILSRVYAGSACVTGTLAAAGTVVLAAYAAPSLATVSSNLSLKIATTSVGSFLINNAEKIINKAETITGAIRTGADVLAGDFKSAALDGMATLESFFTGKLMTANGAPGSRNKKIFTPVNQSSIDPKYGQKYNQIVNSVNRSSAGVGGNKPVPRTGPKGVDPDHHNLNVMVKNSEGNVKSHERFVSGNMTAEEKAMGYPKGQNASHTEARFSRFRGDTLDEGDIVIMTGQLPPCNSCKGYMNRLATEKNVDITYRWREGGVTKVWKAKKK